MVALISVGAHAEHLEFAPEVCERLLSAPQIYDAPAIHRYLAHLKANNFLCDNECKHFERDIDAGVAPTTVWQSIERRVNYHFLEEQKIKTAHAEGGGFLKLANGSRVQGTAHRPGGLQPDYIIDSRSREIQDVLAKVSFIAANSPKNLALIDRIGLFLRTEVLQPTPYGDPSYFALMQRYRERGLEVPLSEYVKIARAVCRESAMLTQLALAHIGFDAYYYYAKVETTAEDGEPNREDHGVTVVQIEGKYWVIDNYFRGFNQKPLRELESETGVETALGSMFDDATTAARGRARLLFPRTYPETRHHPKHTAA